MQSERIWTQRAWTSLRATLVSLGLSEPLLRLGLLGLVETRRHLALCHLPPEGHGLEIGALHYPLPLPPGARARYVDRHSAQALRELRADVGADIVIPDIITEGFTLDCITEASQDFVVANHVLEHATDALGTLEHWLRVLRPGGMLFVAVPVGARCSDRGRTITPVEHFIEDRRLTAAGNTKAMHSRDRQHVEEHLAIAAPALARLQGKPWQYLTGEAREREIKRLLGRDASQIHHHVFTPASFAALLNLLSDRVHIDCVVRSSVEIIGVARRR